MLSQRFDSLKSQTIPNMDGQDESFGMEIPYDLLAMTNSCPDLSILVSGEESPVTSAATLMDIVRNTKRKDGNKSASISHEYAPLKIPLSYRRSTSLNSLEAEGYPRETSSSNTVDGNVAGVLLSGTVAKVVGKLEDGLQSEQRRVQNSSEFTKSIQRSSYTGPGFFHKSISSPSMQSISPNIPHVSPKLLQLSQNKSDDCPATTKRSFFRRKQKRKRAAHPKAYIGERDKMNGTGDAYQDSLGTIGLTDPFLALKEADVECWAKFMKPDIVGALTDKEVKRQEHMYEIILTEKHHCLTLALMHHLFLNDMKNSGFSREARLLFPGLTDLLQVHLHFFRRLKEKQLDFWARDEPLDTLSDLLMEQFSGDQWLQMIRLYGLLCSSLEKSFELFKVMKQKDQKFAGLVTGWNKESLLSRKNVTECLLLVGQRITKYPLLIEPLIKINTCPLERVELQKALMSSKELNSRVNERVAERERLAEACSKIDSKSFIHDGQRRIRGTDLLTLPNRRLIFNGLAIVNRIVSGNLTSLGVCNVLILTDSMICTQEVGGKVSFVSPPGLVMLNHIIVRENAGHELSLYLVMGSGSKKPEMIELQVRSPGNRPAWLNAFRDAQILFEEEIDLFSDFDEDIGESVEGLEFRAMKGLEELHEHDKKILTLLKSRSKVIESLRTEKPYYWTMNSFDGKDRVLGALSEAATEIQKTLQNMDVNSNTVNRSASCVSAHVTSVLGLPKRADTFGGFDSQQRTPLDAQESASSKILTQLVVQLADVCGEMFQQMIPNLSLNISQNNNHLQRRMEELREAQQRFEAEKAQWQSTLLNQKQEVVREREELNSMKEALQKQEIDVSHQREQLYRKLEKLETHGIKPFLDSVTVSPISVTTNFDKSSVPSMASRRSPSQSTLLVTPSNSSVGSGAKQQLPLHLAALTRSQTTSSLITTENPRPLPRMTPVPVPLGSPNSISHPAQSQPSEGGRIAGNPIGRVPSTSRVSTGSLSSASIQQMLPLRLSEGLALKASSLPRGVAPKTVSGPTQPPAPLGNNNGYQFSRNLKPNSHSLHHSKSSTSILMGNDSGYSPLHPPRPTDRMSNYYYRDLHSDGIGRGQVSNPEGGEMDPTSTSNNQQPTVVHRRSGSSPVPMSTSAFPYTQNQNQVRIPYTKYSQNEDEDDSSKILFL